MGCHPNPIDEYYIFQDGEIAPPTSSSNLAIINQL